MTKARQLADLGNVYDDGALSNRNMIINGAMQVAQRGTSATGVSTSGYIVDRFNHVVSGYGTWTREQSNDAPDGFANSLKVTCTTPDTSPSSLDFTRISYNAEGHDRQVLSYGTSNAKDVTISFWVKSNVSATYVFWVFQHDSPTTRHINKLFTIDSANTWEYKTITVEGDTLGQLDNDTGSCMIMGWILASGTGYTSGTRPSTWTAHTAADRWAGLTADVGGAANNYLQITGVQLELGDTATPFEHRSYGDELAKCQRYFETRDFHQQVFARGNTSGTGDVNTYLPFLVKKRAVPSVSQISGDSNLVFVPLKLEGTRAVQTPGVAAGSVRCLDCLIHVDAEL